MAGIGLRRQAFQHWSTGQSETETEKVHEHPSARPENTHSGATAIAPDYGLLMESSPECASSHQKFHVEGHATEPHPGKDGGDEMTAEDLGAALGVGKGQPKEKPDPEVEDEAGDSPAKRAGGHVSHGDGGVEALRTFQKPEKISGRGGAVSIDECQPRLVRRLPESRKHGATLPYRVIVSDPIQVPMLLGERFDDFLSAVGAPVEDDEKLGSHLRSKGRLGEIGLQCRSDARRLILGRHDDQHAAAGVSGRRHGG